MPARSASRRRACGERGELLVGRGARRLGRHADAARRVRRARHPRRELVAPVAREHEVRVRVHEPRDHAPPARVDPLVAHRARALDRGHDAVLDHQRGVAHEAERALAERGVVGDEQTDLVDDERGHDASASPQLARRRRARRVAVADAPAAADHTSADVGGGGGEDDGRGGLFRRGPGEADAVERDGGEVGERAGLDPAALRPAERRVAARRRRAQQVRRRWTPRTPVASRSSSSIARASSNGSMTACESLPVGERRAGLHQPPRGPDAVGEVALRRRAQAAGDARAAEQLDVVVGQVRRVDRHGPTAIHATHLTDEDVALLGGAGATVCLCPTTERDLADGIGPARRLAEAGAALATGSDSHAVIDPFEEARAIELDERLATGVRGIHRAPDLLRRRPRAATRRSAGRRAAGSRPAPSPTSPRSRSTPSASRDRARHAAASTVYAATAADVAR